MNDSKLEEPLNDDIDLMTLLKRYWIQIALLIVVLSLFPYLASLSVWIVTGKQNSRAMTPNEIGDSFGFMNSIMSSVASVGIVFTIYLQQKQLRLQTLELLKQEQERLESLKELRTSAQAQTELAEFQLLQMYLYAKSLQLQTQNQSLLTVPNSGMPPPNKNRQMAGLIENLTARLEEPVSRIISHLPVSLDRVWNSLIVKSQHLKDLMSAGDQTKIRNSASRFKQQIEQHLPALGMHESNESAATISILKDRLLPLLDRSIYLSQEGMQSRDQNMKNVSEDLDALIKNFMELSISSHSQVG